MRRYNLPKVEACATAQLAFHSTLFCISLFQKKSNFLSCIKKILILCSLNCKCCSSFLSVKRKQYLCVGGRLMHFLIPYTPNPYLVEKSLMFRLMWFVPSVGKYIKAEKPLNKFMRHVKPMVCG